MHRRVTIPAKDHDEIQLTFVVEPLRTTGEYVEFQVMMGRVDLGGDVTELVQALWDRIVVEDMEYPSLTLDKLPGLIGDVGIGALATEVMAAGVDPSVLEGMRRILDIAHQAGDYDPDMDPPCECRACTGQVEHDPACLFVFERPMLSDIFAGWDWGLIQQCWDLPFYVYQGAVEQRRAKNRGEAAQYQEQKRERERQKQAGDIREKRLGTRDWHAIAKARGA